MKKEGRSRYLANIYSNQDLTLLILQTKQP